MTLQVAAEAADGLDTWLREHIAELLQLPGFVDAETSTVDNDDGHETRVVRYFMASSEDLDNYLAGAAAEMRARTVARFGEHLTASRRVLHPRPGSDAASMPHCLNCNTPLLGQYCGECGQRAQSRLISVWELLRDAFGDLIDADSRLWRTVVQLAMRPGYLTHDYLRGRRARYMPPFRTYLVLSLLFFVIAFFDPKQEFSLFFETQDVPATTVPGGIPGSPEAQDEISAAGIEVPPADEHTDRNGIRVSVDTELASSSCEMDDYDEAEMPAWIASRLTRERIEQICLKMTSEDGEGLRGFLDKLLEYVPAGLFVLLPLMALVLKLLYPLTRRYYVEHLLFVVHFHAFVFLALIVQVLLARGGALFAVPETVLSLVLFAIPIYVPVYLYKAVRRVYGQARWLSACKFVLLFVTYWIGLAALLAIVAIFAAFSV